MSKITELRQKSDKDLYEELAVQQKNLADLFIQRKTSELKQVHEFRQIKKSISQIKTLLRERKLAVQEKQNG